MGEWGAGLAVCWVGDFWGWFRIGVDGLRGGGWWARMCYIFQEGTSMDYAYAGTVTNIVDGDTLDVLIDLGLRITTLQRVRLYGINTPEHTQPGFKEATDRAVSLVLNQPVIARTIKPTEKYGRWLASIQLTDGRYLAAILIEEGFGVPYFGGTKAPQP